jgi:acetoin utilization protein AcuB
MRLELVKDWMSREVVTISPAATLAEAYQVMVERAIRRLPVVENGRLRGIITLNDIRNARPASGHPHNALELSFALNRLTVADMMTPDPQTITTDATIDEAAQQMLALAISSLPVLDNHGQLVGILTESDIFRLVVHTWQTAQEGPSEPYAHYGA